MKRSRSRFKNERNIVYYRCNFVFKISSHIFIFKIFFTLKSLLSDVIVKVNVQGLQTGQGELKHGLHVNKNFLNH